MIDVYDLIVMVARTRGHKLILDTDPYWHISDPPVAKDYLMVENGKCKDGTDQHFGFTCSKCDLYWCMDCNKLNADKIPECRK